MNARILLLATPLVLSCGATALSQSICELHDGNARFAINFDLTWDFEPDSTVDHLAEGVLWTRRNGIDPFERRISNLVGFSCGGNVGVLQFSEPDFDLQLRATLTDGPNPGQATVDVNEVFSNTGEGDLSLSVFQYVDYDVADTTSNDEGVLVASDLMRAIDPVTGDFADFEITGADAYQVTEWPVLLNLLDDLSLTNLDNTGLPFGPGDITGAFQSVLLIPNLGQETVVGRLAINIPEPAALSFLAIGALAVFALRRR